MLLFFRCLVFIGVCVEFVAAVAWLAELFPDPKRREAVLGYTQAFSSIGGLLVAVANGIAVAVRPTAFRPICDSRASCRLLGTIDPMHQHEPWRYTLMSGLIPAMPLILIRPFLPESPVWAAETRSGHAASGRASRRCSRPSCARTTIVTAIGFACSWAWRSARFSRCRRSCPACPRSQAGAQEGRRSGRRRGQGRRARPSPTSSKAIGRRGGRTIQPEDRLRIHEDAGNRRPGRAVPDGRGSSGERDRLGLEAADVSDSRADPDAARVLVLPARAEHDVLRNSAGERSIWARFP